MSNIVKHFVMSSRGHDMLSFDKTNDSQVNEAMARFKELISKGYTAAAREPGTTGDYKLIRKFNPDDEVLFIPAMQGG